MKKIINIILTIASLFVSNDVDSSRITDAENLVENNVGEKKMSSFELFESVMYTICPEAYRRFKDFLKAICYVLVAALLIYIVISIGLSTWNPLKWVFNI